MSKLDDASLDLIFRNARTQNAFTDKPVPTELLQQVYDLTKWGPTSTNCSPMRIVFVATPEGKERLKPLLAPGNVARAMSAPVTAIIGMDMEFYEKLPVLSPKNNAINWFVGNDALIESTAMRNSTLQGGYFMLAARSLGLDCGPMSGFDNAKVDAEFFKGTKVKSNFICSLGYGDVSKLYPRSVRLDFAEACKVV